MMKYLFSGENTVQINLSLIIMHTYTVFKLNSCKVKFVYFKIPLKYTYTVFQKTLKFFSL